MSSVVLVERQLCICKQRQLRPNDAKKREVNPEFLSVLLKMSPFTLSAMQTTTLLRCSSFWMISMRWIEPFLASRFKLSYFSCHATVRTYPTTLISTCHNSCNLSVWETMPPFQKIEKRQCFSRQSIRTAFRVYSRCTTHEREKRGSMGIRCNHADRWE